MFAVPVILNLFIHVLMYSYYFLSSFGKKWQKRLTPWKKKLTMAQMVNTVNKFMTYLLKKIISILLRLLLLHFKIEILRKHIDLKWSIYLCLIETLFNRFSGQRLYLKLYMRIFQQLRDKCFYLKTIQRIPII